MRRAMQSLALGTHRLFWRCSLCLPLRSLLVQLLPAPHMLPRDMGALQGWRGLPRLDIPHCWLRLHHRGTGQGCLLPSPRNFPLSLHLQPRMGSCRSGGTSYPPPSLFLQHQRFKLGHSVLLFILSKLWKFSDRFKSFGKQRILLWGNEYTPDYLSEGWMQRKKTEGRKSP